MEFQRHELVHFLRNPTRLKNLVKRAKNLANEANYGAVKNSLRDKGYGEIHFYGSRIMEMSRRLSDIDIFISVGTLYQFFPTKYCEIKDVSLLRQKLLAFNGSRTQQSVTRYG